jgi:hypothetical protein
LSFTQNSDLKLPFLGLDFVRYDPYIGPQSAQLHSALFGISARW